MEIYRSNFVTRSFLQQKQLLISTWLPFTRDMEEIDFKDEMLQLTLHISHYKANYLLTVTNNMKFTISTEIQDWIVEIILPMLEESALKKQAMVSPKDFFAKLSLEQTIDDVEKNQPKHATRMFESFEEAMKWLE
ncbi:hypothetical protein [Flexithrix dorotheae]|uniref:hypothetical protein n=1 Tax=Flexithrix dorotheae TaxID=70993 RepID=UPI00036E1D95|nr:hypothetical protein [Flexithrix dorotheae]